MIHTKETLKKVVDMVFEKAMDKSGFSVPCSKLCKILGEKVVEAEDGKLLLERYNF